MSHLKLVTDSFSPQTAIYVEALEHLDTGMCLVDEDGTVLASNRNFRALLDLPANWPDPAGATTTRSAAEELVAGWTARVEAQGDFVESVALSEAVTLRVAGKAMPSGGISLTLAETADGEQREMAEYVARFRALVAHMPSTISLKDADGRFVFVNEAWEREVKIPAEQMLGKTIWDALPNHDWSESDAHDQLLLAGERNLIEDNIVVHIAGRGRRVFRRTKFPVLDADARPAGVGTINTDITELVHAQEELRRSEDGLRHGQRLAKIGHWERNFVTGEIFWSEPLFDFFEIEKGSVPGVETLVRRLHPEDRQKLSDAMAATIGGKKYQELEFRVRQASGEERYLRDVLEAEFDGEGRPWRVFGVLQDITETKLAEAALRESEARFRALVDNLPAGVVLKGADGDVIFINGRIEQWYGVPLERIAGRKFHDLTEHSGENLAVHEKMLDAQRTVMESGNTVDVEHSITFADGSVHDLHAIIFPVERGDGVPNDIGSITFDVTDRRRTDEMLRQAQKMEVVGQLTGGVAHDFNNLLAVVIGNLELAADELRTGSPALDFVRSAFNAAERGASLTHHLLAFSRQQVLQPEDTDIGELVAETRDLMAVSMGERIGMGVWADTDLWRCKVDRVQLQNAILNLSINARDAMPSGGEVTIGAANVTIDKMRATALEIAAGDYVCLSMRDSGPGIPRKVLQHVYEPFFTTKQVGEGSGLGLSMVYGFARQSGGAVDIDTAAGEGTTVRLYFPALPASVAAASDARPR